MFDLFKKKKQSIKESMTICEDKNKQKVKTGITTLDSKKKRKCGIFGVTKHLEQVLSYQ